MTVEERSDDLDKIMAELQATRPATTLNDKDAALTACAKMNLEGEHDVTVCYRPHVAIFGLLVQ